MAKETMTTITIRISQEEKEKLQKLAEKDDLTMSYLVRRAIKEYLKNN